MDQYKKIPVVGVVGGIGSGKSTVAKEFERLGCYRIDCDKLGHALLDEDDVKREIREEFGASIFDNAGAVIRNALGEIVFQEPAKLKTLERILHPRIRERIVQEIEAGKRTNCPAVVVDAAVLFEAGWDDLCTQIVFVDAPQEDRLLRVKTGRNWDADTLQKREAQQIPLDKKATRCDHSIRNHSSVSHLQEQVCRLLHHITHE